MTIARLGRSSATPVARAGVARCRQGRVRRAARPFRLAARPRCSMSPPASSRRATGASRRRQADHRAGLRPRRGVPGRCAVSWLDGARKRRLRAASCAASRPSERARARRRTAGAGRARRRRRQAHLGALRRHAPARRPRPGARRRPEIPAARRAARRARCADARAHAGDAARLWGGTRAGVLLVTHGIEEALLLATRIVVLAPGPGRIVADRSTPVSAGATPPASKARAIKADPAFIAPRGELIDAIFERRGSWHDALAVDEPLRPTRPRPAVPWSRRSRRAVRHAWRRRDHPGRCWRCGSLRPRLQLVSPVFLPPPAGGRGRRSPGDAGLRRCDAAAACLAPASAACSSRSVRGPHRRAGRASPSASAAIGRGIFDPLIEFLRPIPPLAYLPLVIIWFGIGEPAKILVIALAMLAPVAHVDRGGRALGVRRAHQRRALASARRAGRCSAT